jgi:acyl carrier protein
MAAENAVSREQVLQCIYATVDELNATLPPGRQLAKHPDAPLFGREAPLDSLGLVSLIVDLEQRLAEALGAGVVLADERALSRRSSPFRSIDTLARYVVELAGGGAHA